MKILPFVCSLCWMLGCSPVLLPQESKFADGNRVVCQDVVPVGSHLKQRVCTTVAANAEESKQAKDVLSDAQQRLRDEVTRERDMRRAPSGP